jgi:N-acetylmuramoyl-L-alanine amidase
LKSLNPTVRTIIEDLKNTARLERSALAATKIADSWMGERKTTRNTIQQASLFLVAAATVPSVLVEMGFLTHPNEARLLSSEDYRQKIIDGLTEALLRYKETLDKT